MTSPSPAVLDLVTSLSRSRPGLEIDVSSLTRAQFAYDASNYRLTPQAVAHPRDVDDVVAIVRQAHRLKLPITTRGSGTSMAGNAVGTGLVLNLARHMNRVLRVDDDARTATVEAGVVLDSLQEVVRPYGLMFGPDPSSHSRATLGGMIGNDACGNHSVAYGRTGDHVLELDLVLADGVRVRADSTGITAVDPADEQRVRVLERGLRELIQSHLAVLRTELDRVPRQVSGYHLHQLLPERGFDVARSLVGSEGTLAIVVAATVQLVSRPSLNGLTVIGYDDIAAAAEDVPTILELKPAAVEGMDQAIVETMRARRGEAAVGQMPEGNAWLYVEFLEDDPDLIAHKVAQLKDRVRAEGRAREVRWVTSGPERAAIWRVREDGAGLSAIGPGGIRTWPGWEDAAVAPDRLASYLRDFRNLLQAHGFDGVLYGHFGAGCIHVRINFTTDTAAGRDAMRSFVVAAAELVTSHGGTLSGEHGDGRSRSELLPLMYTPTVMSAFAQLKTIWDPDGMLNPGVLINPDALSANIPSAPPALPATFALVDDDGDLAKAAGRCIGIGRCIADTGGVMCPSYRATHDEKDSTRGRARALQSWAARADTPDTADGADILRTLDLCLSCKACSTDCPTGTDMATYKSEFLHQHYRGQMRPLTHYTLGWLPTALRATRWIAPVVNAMLSSRWVVRALPRLAGITSERRMPRFASSRSISRELAQVPRSGGRALLFVDSFTRGFRPELVGSAQRVLAAAGVQVELAPDVCCGLTWITTGQLGVARRVLRRTVRLLNRPAASSLPIIVLEPSCASALAHDLPALLQHDDARAVAGRVLTFDQALHTLADPEWEYPELPENGTLQTHCHEYATFRSHKQSDSLRGHGMTNLQEATGCCGLAGNFGFEADHYSTSVAVAGQALLPALDRSSESDVVLADGFSCATQISQLRPDRKPLHLAQLLDALLAERSAAPDQQPESQGRPVS
ncbi:FAD-binding and (Fe-S)-binding domain-containing protein [Mycolicibacterium confluentis]|uniref:Lactate dehydrogenase n=1 Tax=Mycolicibacterium confluentis TaxID=28047 RepID=A0A7I7Y444_9MYCO|nr:FAD-binding and (Fe-S)-binding domain-containing protein [Mycolicibacterium confluentis]MCV7322670.1 FAD-binding oxidoreductase [Mycolicibacterium confluentis]BBZ36428.1 lactate dehydrogenase [Mycolicibacterium confluentis]